MERKRKQAQKEMIQSSRFRQIEKFDPRLSSQSNPNFEPSCLKKIVNSTQSVGPNWMGFFDPISGQSKSTTPDISIGKTATSLMEFLYQLQTEDEITCSELSGLIDMVVLKSHPKHEGIFNLFNFLKSFPVEIKKERFLLQIKRWTSC